MGIESRLYSENNMFGEGYEFYTFDSTSMESTKIGTPYAVQLLCVLSNFVVLSLIRAHFPFVLRVCFGSHITVWQEIGIGYFVSRKSHITKRNSIIFIDMVGVCFCFPIHNPLSPVFSLVSCQSGWFLRR